MGRRGCRFFFVFSVFLAWAANGARAEIDPALLAGMKARSIGPAGMSGRVTAVEAVESDPDVVYVGSATGGAWKSSNGGLTWEPIFDDQPVASIGAVAVFQASPDIVWIGTGEGNPRNSASVGNGVYRSLDGGETWAHLGLEKTERIHRIVLHPSDPQVAYVAALGRAWGENPERGVFRTTDGGRTWSRVLHVDDRTGAADLAMDPSNPGRLLAAMWEYRRWPWFFRSGGPGSGLHLTVDGGETWKRLGEEAGLPAGDLGRIGVSFCRDHPDTVYAIVEAEESAIVRSDDGGEKWFRVNLEPDVAPRPFYFADIRVDPERPDRLYSLWSLLSVSDDGGKSFRVLARFRDVHPDFHAMWIDPSDPDHLIAGNDGGVAVSRDRGETWRFVRNLPLAQYYHIAVDMDTPYHVYGGMQDNGSWRGPSAVWENGGIRNHHWEEVGFGDGFDTRPDPEDSLRGYSMSQEGYLRRWNLRTGERKDIRPPAPAGVELRFNWNAAFAIDPFDPATIYYGSQFVHRSRDRGESWEIVSPDLTTDRAEWQKQAESGGLTPDVTGAENFTAILVIAPSPVARGVIWVGTDDGRIHVTRDGGARWSSVEGKLRGVPENTWVPHIEPSRFDAATAFVVLDNHRRSDWTPYVFRTTDYGKSWKSLAGRNVEGYALSIVQDFLEPNLLFLGTEFGLWVSLDGGRDWLPFRHGLPTVSVMDLALQTREHDLVIGTHGRGAYVLDDVRPLRALSSAVLAEPLRLFEIADAQQYGVKQTAAPRFAGHGEFRGENRPYGAILTFSLSAEGLPSPEEFERREEQRRLERAAAGRKRVRREAGESGEEAEEDVPEATIRILDAGGDEVRVLEVPVHAGVNRQVWDLRRDPFREPPRERPWWRTEPEGPEVLPGTYRVVVAYGDHEAEGEVRVLADPRSTIAVGDRKAKWEAIRRAGGLQESIAEAVSRIADFRADVEAVARKVKAARAGEASKTAPDEAPDALVRRGEALAEALVEIEMKLWVPPKTKGILPDRDALSKVGYVIRSLSSSWDAPTPSQMRYLEGAEELLGRVLDELDAFFADEVSGYSARVREEGIGLFAAEQPLE